MNRKSLDRLTASFNRRGGRFGMTPGTSDEMTLAFLDQLLDCPDCRAVVLEACNADDRKDVDIDAVIRDLVLTRDH